MKAKLLKIFMKMLKYAIFCIILQSSLYSFATSYSSKGQVKMLSEIELSIAFNNSNLEQVFQDIEKNTEFTFAYLVDDLPEEKVTLSGKSRSLKEILLTIAEQAGVSFRRVNETIHVKPSSNSRGIVEEVIEKTIQIIGTVTSADGEPLPGVNVLVKDTNIGTVTDIDGNYSITVPDENNILVFSFIGFITQEVPINGRTSINISLTEDVQSLNEVVVVGYGSQEKVNLTGSVSSINAEELIQAPMPTLAQSMMGRTSGVFIKNVNGQPGDDKGIEFNIRGFGEPLIIVDGMPVSEAWFQQLNPNDIESFNVLKDAAAAAVYGARAGNGVILVTTKRGKESAPKFSYSSNFGLQFITKQPQKVDAAQHAEMENVANMNMGKDAPWTEEEIQKFRDGSDPENYPNTDFFGAVIRDYAPQSQHNLSVRGGSENVKYFVSAGYFNQRGMLKSDDMDHNRYSLRSNVDIQLTEKLSAGLDMSVINQDYIGPRHQLERSPQAAGLMTRLLRSKSNTGPYDPGGMHSTLDLMEMEVAGYKKWNKTFGDAKLNFEYDLPFGFKARAVYNANRTYHRYKDKTHQLGKTKSKLIEQIDITNNLNQQYFLTWDRQFGDHDFNALFVYERLSNDYDIFWASRQEFDFDIDYLFAGPDLNKDNGGSAREGGRKGYIGRLNYNFQGKYMLEVNSRWDASPNFPEETRWGVFPSASVGWRLSEEGFIKDNLSFIDNLKIRASHGRLGYDRAGNFQYLNTYSLSSSYLYKEKVLSKSLKPNALPNPYITWEKMTTTNAGIDFNLFGNKLEGSVDYFYRKRTDVLGKRNRSMPDVVGANLPKENYEEYDNRGVELSLDHRNSIGNVKFSVGGNVSWTREKTLYVDQNEFSTMEAFRKSNRIGEWTDRNWVYPTDGLFKSKEEIESWADIDGKNNATILPGDVKFIDTNGDGLISGDDMIIGGRGVFPKLNYGINLTASWNGFDFSMLWQGAGAYDFSLWNRTGYLIMPFYSGISPLQHMYEDSYVPENPWLPTNTNGKWPLYRYNKGTRNHPSFSNRHKNSQFWLVNGAYIRLKTIQLAYTLPKQLVERVGVERCRVYVSGYNVLTFSALDFVDPEIDTKPRRTFGDYHPPLGSYNLGVEISF